MCAVSFIGDTFTERWRTNPPFQPFKPWDGRQDEATKPLTLFPPGVSRAEFDALKREVELLRDLLKKAIDYDKATNQPDCEQAEKVALLKAVAKMVGVELPI